MKRRIKLIFVLLLSSMCVFVFSFSAFAVDSNIDEYAEEFDFESVISSVDDDTLHILREIGIDELSMEKIFSVEPSKVFSALFNMVSTALKEPMQFLLVSTGVLILCSLLTSIMSSPESVSLAGGSVLALGAAVPVATMVTTSFSVLETLGVFTTAFTGVFCGVVSAAGGYTASITHSALTMFSNSLFSGILTEFSQPVVSAMCSLGFLSCFDILDFSTRFSSTVKKVYVFVMSFIGTVFSGIITVKGVLSDGVDSLTAKSIRFVVGRSLPVVGGTVSETYSALVSSLGLIKNTVGVFGIITVIVTVLPTLINLLVWILVLEISLSISETFGTSKAMGMLNVLKDTLVLLVATIVIVATIFIVSVGVVIVTYG